MPKETQQVEIPAGFKFNQGEFFKKYNYLLRHLEVEDKDKFELDNLGVCNALSLMFHHYDSQGKLNDFFEFIGRIEKMKIKDAKELVQTLNAGNDAATIDGQEYDKSTLVEFAKKIRLVQSSYIYNVRQTNSKKLLGANTDNSISFILNPNELEESKKKLEKAMFENGRYVVGLPGHRISITKNNDDTYTYFDPNFYKHESHSKMSLDAVTQKICKTISQTARLESLMSNGISINIFKENFALKKEDVEKKVEYFINKLGSIGELPKGFQYRFSSIFEKVRQGELSSIIAIKILRKILIDLNEVGDKKYNYLEKELSDFLVAYPSSLGLMDLEKDKLTKPMSEDSIQQYSGLFISAIEIGDIELISYLLDMGMNPNLMSGSGLSALQIAARDNNNEILRLILSSPKVRVNDVVKMGDVIIGTALDVAISSRSANSIYVLLTDGKCELMTHLDTKALSEALIDFIENGNEFVVEALLKIKVSPTGKPLAELLKSSQEEWKTEENVKKLNDVIGRYLKEKNQNMVQLILKIDDFKYFKLEKLKDSKIEKTHLSNKDKKLSSKKYKMNDIRNLKEHQLLKLYTNVLITSVINELRKSVVTSNNREKEVKSQHAFIEQLGKIKKKLNEPSVNISQIQKDLEFASGKYLSSLEQLLSNLSLNHQHKSVIEGHLDATKVGVGKSLLQVEKLNIYAQSFNKTNAFIKWCKSFQEKILNLVQKKRSLFLGATGRAKSWVKLQEAQKAKFALEFLSKEKSEEAKVTELNKLDDNRYVTVFNDSPKKSIDLFPAEMKNVYGISDFLIKNYEHLNPIQVADYLGDENNNNVLKIYVSSRYNFREKEFLASVREFMETFELPNVTQKNDRIMNSFCERYHRQNPKVFSNKDSAYILTLAVVMLNIDAHNPQIPKNRKMTEQQFINKLRGANNGIDFPKNRLIEIYNDVTSNEIIKADSAKNARPTIGRAP